MKGTGHNVQQMSAEDKERSAKALRMLRDLAVRARSDYDNHVQECPCCARETTWSPAPGEAGVKVILHCQRGLDLAMTAKGQDAVFQSSATNLASFGVFL